MDYRSLFETRKYKILRGKIGKALSDINHIRILYDPPPRIMEIEAKNKQTNKQKTKWDIIKLKSFCTTKETISKVKRHIQNERK